MVAYWIFTILFGLVSLLCLIWFVGQWATDGFDEDVALPGFLFLLFGSIELAILFNVDYTVTKSHKVYPSEIKMMHDDEEVIVKHEGHRWEIKEHKQYVQLLDSNFYIQVYDCYNIFGHKEPIYYTLESFDEEDHDQENEDAISIEL
jgi:hypothetical protein